MENLVDVSHTACTYVAGPKNLGTYAMLGTHPLGFGVAVC